MKKEGGVYEPGVQVFANELLECFLFHSR